MRKLVLFALVPALLYPFLLLLLSFEHIQRHAIYMASINWPLFARYDQSEYYGFEAGTWSKFLLPTPDGAQIGVTYMKTTVPSASERRAILYFHGNAGHRLTSKRRKFAKQLLDLGYDHVAVDYRGFGDSSKTYPPSEGGLNIDAQTVWDWLTQERGLQSDQIVLAGHSLGTGVAANLAAKLSNSNTQPRGLILIAPYTSIARLLETYRLFKVLPILKPIKQITVLHELLLRFLQTHFDTRSIIQHIACPILLLHSKDDWDIISTHSEELFADLSSGSEVLTKAIEGYGRVHQAKGREGQKVVYLESEEGGHNKVMTSRTAALYIQRLVEGED